MTRLTISMPDQMGEYVEAQINTGRYGNVSEYFRDLVRRDQDQRAAAEAALRDLLNQAEASGESDRSMAEILDAARAAARAKGLIIG